MRSGTRPSAPCPSIPDLVDPQLLTQDASLRRFSARHGNQSVVVTVLNSNSQAQSILARLRDETYQGLPEFRHPQIVPLLAWDLAAAEPWLLHATPAGRPLIERLSDGAIPLATALAWGVDLCRGLEAIQTVEWHHLGVDGTTVWCEGDAAVLSGLGLAHLAADTAPRPDQACLAPEVLLGLPTDIRADIHAVGVLLFRALTGSWPTVIATRRDLDIWARADLPEDRLAGLAPGPAAVLRRAMARRMADRYATPAHLREDLERLSHGFSPLHARPTVTRTLRAPGTATVDHLRRPPISRTLTPVTTDGPSPRRESAQKRGLVLGAVGLGVVASLAAVFALTHRSEVSPIPLPQAAPVVPPAPTMPTWATASGKDAFGPWLDLAVASQRPRLRAIPAGSVWIGSNLDEAGRQSNEGRFLAHTSHRVWMLDREVDQLLYQSITGANPSRFRANSLPVENLTWEDAALFCERLEAIFPGMHARLPTEVEWEIACRASTTGPFAVDRFWDAATSGRSPQPVATLPANAWGFYDLAGNVAEWTSDALAAYPTTDITDRRISSGAQRVARGGSWCSMPADCRSAARSGFMSMARLPYLGLRFVVEDR